MGDDAPDQSLYVEISQLRALVEDLRAWRDRQSRMSAILATAGQPQAPPPPRRKRDRHGLHVVRGFALLAAGGAWRWLARTRVHRVLAGGLVAATAAGSTLAPEMMQPAPAALVPAHHYHAVAHHHRPVMPVAVPAVPAVRKRRRPDNDRTVRPGASVSPSASPVPSADPVPSVTPSPHPSGPVTPPPVPSPRPTCLHPAGRHCHGAAGEVLAALGAWRGLRGLP